MSFAWSRRALGAAVAALLLAGAAAANAPQRAELPTPRPDARGPGADAIVQAANLTGRIGFVLIDAATGEVLEARREAEAFPPASVAKAPTALFALETLGAEHRFETRLTVEGLGADGAARRAVLIGGGDPELDSDALSEMAAQAFARGLRRAEAFVYDASAGPEVERIDAEQPEQVAYNPSISPLTLNFNRVLLGWLRQGSGWTLTMEARARSHSPPATGIEARVGPAGSPVFAHQDDGRRERWTISASALDRRGQRWLPVRRPAAYAASAMRSLAAAQGLSLPEASPGRAGPGEALAFRRSRPLSEILRAMLRHSTNLTAEAVGVAATAARQGAPADLAASAAAMNAWAAARAAEAPSARPAAPSPPPTVVDRAGDDDRTALAAGIVSSALARRTGAASRPAPVATGEFDLKNHSGLSAASRVSPLAMAALLRSAELQGRGRAPAGALGDLLRPLEMTARKGEAALPPEVEGSAKTGTLNYVRGLAGYITAASGRRLVFCIFSEDLARRAAMRDGRATGSSRGWGGRARAMERKLVRGWAAAY